MHSEVFQETFSKSKDLHIALLYVLITHNVPLGTFEFYNQYINPFNRDIHIIFTM